MATCGRGNRPARVDDNHAAIKHIWERMGAKVTDLSAVGKGCPDVLVARAGQLWLAEIKDGAKSASRRCLTPAQVEFHGAMLARGVTVHVIMCEDEAMAMLDARVAA